MSTWLGLLVVFTLVGLIIVVVVICALGAFFSSDEDKSRHPVITWLSATLGLIVVLGVSTVMTLVLGRAYWRIWSLRLRGLTTAATVTSAYVISGSGGDDPDTYRADVDVTGLGGAGRQISVDVPPRVEVGQTIRVRFDPRDPGNALVVRRSPGTLLGAIVVDLILLVFVVGGAGLNLVLASLLLRQFG